MSTNPQDGSQPTVVLVHGAFAESASWNGVIAELQDRGYSVIAVANPLRGLQEDAAYLRSVLDGLSGPVVVAGHSYGGSVMSEAADGVPGVAALVYVASFNLEVGESTAELAAKFPGGELGPALDPVPFPLAGGETGMDLYIQQDRFREVFAADVAPEVADLMAATQRPIAASALEDVATKAAWKTIPSWTLVTTQDLAIPADSMRFMAARAGSTTVEIDASHAVTVSQPGSVADLIDDAARATAGADLSDVRHPRRYLLPPSLSNRRTHMTPALPKPIADYVEANAQLNVDGMLKPFAADVVVLDNGGRHEGHAELRTLLEEAVVGVKAIFTPDTVRHENGQVVVEGPAHGDFPGSPIRFTYRFSLENDAITALEITA